MTCAYCRSYHSKDRCPSCGAPATKPDSILFADQQRIMQDMLNDTRVSAGAIYPVRVKKLIPPGMLWCRGI